MNEPELPKFEDLPEELQLMMQHDALYNEMQHWAGDRDKQRKIQGELDAVLKDKDPERLAEVVKLQGQINRLLSAVHFEGADDSPDSFIGEELPLKRERYVQLMTERQAPEWASLSRLGVLHTVPP